MVHQYVTGILQRQPESNVIKLDDYRQPASAEKQQQALDVLTDLTTRHRANLKAGDYPESKARVSFGDWVSSCMKRGIHSSVTKDVLDSGKAISLHGFIYVPNQTE